MILKDEQTGKRYEALAFDKFDDTEYAYSLLKPLDTKEELVTIVGMMRQWLNEDHIREAKYFVTNKQLQHWFDKYLKAWEELQDE